MSFEYVSAVCWDNVGGRNKIISLSHKGEPFNLDDDGKMILQPFASVKHPFIQDRVVCFCDLKITGGHLGFREELSDREPLMRNMDLRVGFTQKFDLTGGDRSQNQRVADSFISICEESKINHVRSLTLRQSAFSKFSFDLGLGDPLEVCDAVWIARWFLRQACDRESVELTMHPTSQPSDSLSTYLDTKLTRDVGGIGVLDLYKNLLLEDPRSSIVAYRRPLDSGVSIPLTSEKLGKGHLVDHRPTFDSDPYQVVTFIVDRIKCLASV